MDHDLRHQMHVDLIEAYNRVAGSCWSQRQAYERMVKQPAKRYYVTPKRAYLVIAKMMKGDFEKVNFMLPARRRMFYSLYDVVLKLTEKPAFIGKSLWYIMPYAVTTPAPEFFIGWEEAKRVRRWLKHGIIRDDGSVDKSRVGFILNAEAKRKKKIEDNGCRT